MKNNTINREDFTFIYKGKKYEIISTPENYGGEDNRPFFMDEVEMLFKQHNFKLFDSRLTNAILTGHYKEIT